MSAKSLKQTLTDDAVVPGGLGECARLLAADRHPGGRVEVVLEEVARRAVVHDLRAQFGGRVLS